MVACMVSPVVGGTARCCMVMKAIDSEKCAIAPKPSPLAGGARMKLQRRRRFVTAPPFFRRRAQQRGIAPIVKITHAAEKTARSAPSCRCCIFAAHNRPAAIQCGLPQRGVARGFFSPRHDRHDEAQASGRAGTSRFTTCACRARPLQPDFMVCKASRPSIHAIRSTDFYCCLTWSRHGMVV